MTQNGDLTTLGELLDEHAELEQDEDILEKLKELAQEYLSDGWTRWEIANISKEDVFGSKIEPNVLNKRIFALPTVGLVRAFIPDADHLSEKRYTEIRYKLLDCAFTRALTLGPPAIANRIRGSATRTELFKQSVETLRPLLHTRAEADKILSSCLSQTEETSRKRRSLSTPSRSQELPIHRRRTGTPPPSRSDEFQALNQKMDNMFSILLEKIEQGRRYDSDKENYSEQDADWDENTGTDSECSSWKAPNLIDDSELEFLPTTKEAEPLIPEPSAQLKKEGIDCQRLGTDGWNRIRYKEVEKHLHVASVFSALKM